MKLTLRQFKKMNNLSSEIRALLLSSALFIPFFSLAFPSHAAILSTKGRLDKPKDYSFRVRGRLTGVGGGFSQSAAWAVSGNINENIALGRVKATGTIDHIIPPPDAVGGHGAAEKSQFDLEVTGNGSVRSVDRNKSHPPHKDNHCCQRLTQKDGKYTLTLKGIHSGPGNITSNSAGDGGALNQPKPLENSLDLALGDFQTFDFNQEIFSEDESVSLSLLDFNLRINLIPTPDPELFDVTVEEFNFEFSPFDIPNTDLNNLNRQVLVSQEPDDIGFLDLGTNLLDLGFFNTAWLDINGNTRANSRKTLDTLLILNSANEITGIEDIINGEGINAVVPEPSTILGLLTIGGIALGTSKKKQS